MHEVEGFVDLGKGKVASDEGVQGNLAFIGLVDELRHLCAALISSESSALPHATNNQLEGSGRDLVSTGSDANDSADAPTLVSALQSLTHGLDPSDTLE